MLFFSSYLVGIILLGLIEGYPKPDTISNLFVEALTESPNPRKYWSVLKTRLKEEGSKVTTNCSQLKMLAPDGKMRLRNAMQIDNIFRLIESVSSRKAEAIKSAKVARDELKKILVKQLLEVKIL